MCEFHTQMNGTSRMDQVFEKCIVLGGFQKRVVNTMFKSLELLEDVAGIIKI